MKVPPLSWPRFLAAAAMLAGAGLFLLTRGQAERVPPREPLASFPQRIGNWVGTEIGLQPGVREILGDGDFLVRIYQRSPTESYIDLFVAYFPTQRTGSTIHSPQNCLPGAGWTPLEHARTELALPTGGSVTVNQYVIAKGVNRQLALYWYQAHGRVVASEYWAKIYLVTDSIRLRRSDGALVRIITPLAQGETLEAGQERATEFARQLFPSLDRYIPR